MSHTSTVPVLPPAPVLVDLLLPTPKQPDSVVVSAAPPVTCRNVRRETLACIFLPPWHLCLSARPESLVRMSSHSLVYPVQIALDGRNARSSASFSSVYACRARLYAILRGTLDSRTTRFVANSTRILSSGSSAIRRSNIVVATRPISTSG